MRLQKCWLQLFVSFIFGEGSECMEGRGERIKNIIKQFQIWSPVKSITISSLEVLIKKENFIFLIKKNKEMHQTFDLKAPGLKQISVLATAGNNTDAKMQSSSFTFSTLEIQRKNETITNFQSIKKTPHKSLQFWFKKFRLNTLDVLHKSIEWPQLSGAPSVQPDLLM